MPAMTAEEKLDYVITVLKNTSDLKPDYRKTAAETGCVNANKAQIKFKKIIDDTGKFLLTNGKVTLVDGEDEVPATPKTKAKGPGRPKKDKQDEHGGETTTPPSKKRKRSKKIAEVNGDETEEGDGDTNGDD